MNRVNPIYTAALLLFVLSVLFFKLGSVKRDLQEVQDDYKATEKLATDLSALKEVYEDKTKARTSLQNILNQPSLSSSKIVSKLNGSTASISSDDMDVTALNLLVGKLLNSAYNISLLNIRRESDTQVSFNMEIKW